MPNQNEMKVNEMVMRASSYFLGGSFLLTTIIPSDINTLGLKGWFVFAFGTLICVFSFIIAIFAIPVNERHIKWNAFAGNVNIFSMQHSYFIFAVVILQIIDNIFSDRSPDLLKGISIAFLIAFLLIFVITILTRTSVFHAAKSNLLFILMMSLFSVIWALIEEPNQCGVVLQFSIILASSIRLWYLQKENNREEERNNE